MDEQFMRKKAVLPLITSMALPMVLSMLVNALYNIVDSYFVARISENAMTALSLVYPLQNLVNAIAIGFGVGISAVIALYLGAGKQKRADQAATQGMLWALVHGVLLTGVCIAIIPLFLQAFTKDQAVIDLGVRYGRIVFGFSIIINADLAFEKIFQAVGRMKVTMVGLGLGCLANIILDPLLIFGLGPFPKMGIDGAALATGLGQVLTLVIYLLFYYLRPISVKIRLQHLRPSRHLVGRLYAIGIPAVLNLALPSVLISALNAILAAFSQTYVLILGAYYKLQTFLYLPANGIVQGMRPVIGFNYGAKEYGRVKQIFRTVLVMTATGIMVVGTVLCLVIPGQLIGLFTENASLTVAAGKTALPGTTRRRVHCVRRIGDRFRCAGGTGQGHAVLSDFSLPVFGHHRPVGIPAESSAGRRRRVACLLDHRVVHRRYCPGGVPQSRADQSLIINEQNKAAQIFLCGFFASIYLFYAVSMLLRKRRNWALPASLRSNTPHCSKMAGLCPLPVAKCPCNSRRLRRSWRRSPLPSPCVWQCVRRRQCLCHGAVRHATAPAPSLTGGGSTAAKPITSIRPIFSFLIWCLSAWGWNDPRG